MPCATCACPLFLGSWARLLLDLESLLVLVFVLPFPLPTLLTQLSHCITTTHHCCYCQQHTASATNHRHRLHGRRHSLHDLHGRRHSLHDLLEQNRVFSTVAPLLPTPLPPRPHQAVILAFSYTCGSNQSKLVSTYCGSTSGFREAYGSLRD
jgi:hypothetical protein